MPPVRRGIAVPLVVAVLVGALCVGLFTAAPAAASCGSAGYTYAGLQAAAASAGMHARITATRAPHVRSGHVAAWVGVGGPGEGPHGTSEWIQIGLSAFPGSADDDLYYEVARPGRVPRYTLVETGVAVGQVRDVAVREAGRGTWRVWVGGRPVSPVIWLPGSDNRFRPVVTAESWGGGRNVCNGFAYRFDGISVERARHSRWAPLSGALEIRTGGYRFVRFSRGFLARSE